MTKTLKDLYGEFIRAKYDLIAAFDRFGLSMGDEGKVNVDQVGEVGLAYRECHQATMDIELLLLGLDAEETKKQYNELCMRVHPKTGEVVEIDPEQAWFWTDEWQAGEREADADIAAGRVTSYYSIEEFLEDIEKDD